MADGEDLSRPHRGRRWRSGRLKRAIRLVDDRRECARFFVAHEGSKLISRGVCVCVWANTEAMSDVDAI